MLSIYTDGGSRGNPGLSAIGYVFELDNEIIYEFAQPIGIATNNFAEYKAVLEALKKAKEMGYSEIELYLDSQLVERQLNGVYKVNSEELFTLYKEIINIIKDIDYFKITHINRELNKKADRLVNRALDTNDEFINNNNKEIKSDSYDEIKDFLRVYGLEKCYIKVKDEDFHIKMEEDELSKIMIIYTGLKDILKKYYKVNNIILKIEDI